MISLGTSRSLVQNSLQLMETIDSTLRVLPDTQVLALTQPSSRVALICGGGSGHEPAHSGFVHEDLLTASVNGHIFASPPSSYVLKAIEYVNQLNSGKGVIVIVKNYTGDVLNFGLAIQQARQRGLNVWQVIVQDDITFFGQCVDGERRGLAGTVLLYKILGAASKSISDVDELYTLAQNINASLYTIGVALDGKTNELEIGQGIHGEKGLRRLENSHEQAIIGSMTKEFEQVLTNDEEVVVLLNNLGATTEIEMNILGLQLIQQFTARNWKIRVLLVGKVMTSLNMHGFSITVLKLSSINDSEQLIDFLTQRTQCKSWEAVSIAINPQIKKNPEAIQQQIIPDRIPLPESQVKTLAHLLNYLLEKEGELNNLDEIVGDGDTGSTISIGCQVIKQHLADRQNVISLKDIGDILCDCMGGSIGPLWSSFAYGMGNFITIEGLANGLSQMKELGNATLGDRTMVDVIEPLIGQLQDHPDTPLLDLLPIAKNCCLAASQMKAKKGRSRYLAGKEIGQADPGCELIRMMVQALIEFQQLQSSWPPF